MHSQQGPTVMTPRSKCLWHKICFIICFLSSWHLGESPLTGPFPNHTCYGRTWNPGVVKLHIVAANAKYALPPQDFFVYCQRVPGACSGPKWPPTAPLEHPEKVLSFTKEAERGWKSGARSLSWKSDWKPSISRSFCAIGSYCIFFSYRNCTRLKKNM